ncbi:hypothetical protein ANOBCDAF_03912 [Pleomorphomonas sp. T1.2MG-36]|uniref:hypothetical protein n=1 Tax=Pleomorphomonas sp. T1.2MG-36 TaxID=3041167 RepID=UPI0024775880|nr:hypothetical protein [Pleomorphomonas sp. T1.2MG-36]CAI9417186.1 hypothetical protein ANOBCDAF_03912 [Pleomorphomonas sp. T1.2MG-36]
MEELAVKVVISGPYNLVSYGLLPFVAGALAAIFVPKSELRLARGTYVFAIGLAGLVHALCFFSWAHTAEAIVAGRAWMLMLDAASAWFALGLVLALLAVARSYDAYGHAQGAVLAFIPIANLWLIFSRSRDKSGAVFPWFAKGFVGVVLGLVLATSGNAVTKQILEDRVSSILDSKTFPGETYAQFLVNNWGLRDALDNIFNFDGKPFDVDFTTTLVDMDVEGTTVSFFYRLGALGTMFGVSESSIKANACDTPLVLTLLRAGATFKHVFKDKNGRDVSVVTVRRGDCES